MYDSVFAEVENLGLTSGLNKDEFFNLVRDKPGLRGGQEGQLPKAPPLIRPHLIKLKF